MRARRPVSGSASDWLRHAQSDLALAGGRKTPRLLYEHQCFHAQQAAEKALKALLVNRGIAVPKSHDLAFLMQQLPRQITVPVSLLELPILTKYAVQLRYPGETAPATARDRRRALGLARLALDWAEHVLKDRKS